MNSQPVVDFDYFALEGNLDAQSEKYFKELPARVRCSQVRFNFIKAGRINSMGIALLLRCFKDIRETKKADILLEGLTPMHAMLFKMTGVLLLATPVVVQASGPGSAA